MMSKHKSLSEADQALFRETIGPVRRLHCDRIETAVDRPSPQPRSTENDERQVLHELLTGPWAPDELDTGEELYYCRSGIQRGVLRKLRRGHYRIHAELDLHGMNVAAAHSALGVFLYGAKRQQLTCVRIIHGKGKRTRHKGPVLKAKVNHWLRQRDDVLAFCSARPVDGGTGAVYVLLRRS